MKRNLLIFWFLRNEDWYIRNFTQHMFSLFYSHLKFGVVSAYFLFTRTVYRSDVFRAPSANSPLQITVVLAPLFCFGGTDVYLRSRLTKCDVIHSNPWIINCSEAYLSQGRNKKSYNPLASAEHNSSCRLTHPHSTF